MSILDAHFSSAKFLYLREINNLLYNPPVPEKPTSTKLSFLEAMQRLKLTKILTILSKIGL